MVPENKKYVYLYRIVFRKNDDELFYVGIRTCNCHPNDDIAYMGSPKAFREVWLDSSYSKTKDILKYGIFDEVYEEFRDEEPILIKEHWQKHGLYGDGGKCLNGSAGKAIHPTFFTGANHPMLKEEARRKVIETKRQRYGNRMMSEEGSKKLLDAAKSPERNAKIVETRKKNWEKNPELAEKFASRIREAIGGNKSPNKRPERRKQSSEIQKQKIAEGTFHLFDPKNRIKAGKSSRQTYIDNPELRLLRSKEALDRFEKDPHIKVKMSEARKKWYAENPEKASQKNRKAAETRRQNKLQRKHQSNG